jgi:hypothetical protein
MARGCAGSRGVGKPLRIAVDSVAGTMEAKKNAFAPLSGQCGQALKACYRMYLDLPQYC